MDCVYLLVPWDDCQHTGPCPNEPRPPAVDLSSNLWKGVEGGGEEKLDLCSSTLTGGGGSERCRLPVARTVCRYASQDMRPQVRFPIASISDTQSSHNLSHAPEEDPDVLGHEVIIFRFALEANLISWTSSLGTTTSNPRTHDETPEPRKCNIPPT